MPSVLHLDYETASDVDLTKVGLDVYSAHPSTRVLMASYRIDGGRLQFWEAHQSRTPGELKEALEDSDVEKWGFNAQFERVISRRVLKVRTPRKGWRCSMVLAYMQSFTGRLEDVGEQIGLPLDKQKLKEGKRLIRTFSMPQRVTKNQPYIWRNWITDPDDWEEFGRYNRQDVVTEEAIKTRLSPFPIMQEEWDFYEMDQEINDHGIPVDLDFAENIIWMSNRRKNELLSQMQRITGVDNPNSVSQLLPWLRDAGYPYHDLRKESVEKTLKRLPELFGCPRDVSDDDAPDIVKVMRARQWASRTSVTKAVKAKEVVGSDGRARYLFQFAGASRTQRFSGREIQSQNMMRTPKVLDAEDDEGRKLTFVTDMVRQGDYDGFNLLFSEPMLAFTGCMRGLFRALDGEKFLTCDYRSIESVGLGYLTQCDRMLDVFRNGKDIYTDFGTDFYRKPYEEITRAERQICKPPALGCGYRLGPGTEKDGIKTGLLAYAENMGVEMTLEEAQRAVRVFREGYPEVPQFWYACEKAIRHVLKTHQPYTVGYITFEWLKPYLLIRLPKGRHIYYYKPRLEQRVYYTGKMTRRREKDGGWRIVESEETYTKTIFTYMGRNQKTGQWTRLEGHGGVITENIVQAFTRDILMIGLQRLHEAGFRLVGHAHDEGMALVKEGDNYYTLELMRELMTKPIDWAPGFPLAAAGWEGAFYRK